jgi:lysophospholipase L1-like esterase
MLEDLGGINVDTGAVENFKEWVATEGQTNFIIDNGNYKVGSKTLEVVVDSIPQPPSVITEISEVEFALDEGVPVGTPVFARWTEFTLPVGSIHKDTHYAGGYDELDMTKFAGYLTNVGTPISNLTKDMTDVKAGKYGGSVKESVATTQGRFWQTSIEQLNATIGGNKYQLKEIPTTFKKNIVLLGSSSAQGNGVADYNTTSFWALLRDKLTPKGYNVINRGFSADDTSDGLGRFYRDVITSNPDYVILAFTIGNEGLTGSTVSMTDKIAKYNQFKNNILKMCYMTKQFGAVPIVMTQAPTKNFTLQDYKFAQKFNSELEALGIHGVDWSGAVDAMTGDGQPILSIMFDNVHYNETAHKEIANAFPPTLFDRASFESGSYLKTQVGCVATNTPVTQNPMYYNITDITTFSAFMRFKKLTPELATLMSFTNTFRIFLDASGYIIFADGVNGNITAVNDKNYADYEWHSVGITYSPIDNKVRIYTEGVLRYTGTSAPVVPNKWTIGGRTGSDYTFKGGFIKDMALWRTRWTDDRMMSINQGTFPQTSLEIYSPGHDKNLAPGVSLVNLAATTVNLQVGELETALTSPANPSL